MNSNKHNEQKLRRLEQLLEGGIYFDPLTKVANYFMYV